MLPRGFVRVNNLGVFDRGTILSTRSLLHLVSLLFGNFRALQFSFSSITELSNSTTSKECFVHPIGEEYRRDKCLKTVYTVFEECELLSIKFSMISNSRTPTPRQRETSDGIDILTPIRSFVAHGIGNIRIAKNPDNRHLVVASSARYYSRERCSVALIFLQ